MIRKEQFTMQPLATWRLKAIGLLRILFGTVWLGDAWFKWQPDFIHNFETYLNGSLDDQPDWVAS